MSRKTTIATSILADQDPLEGVGPIGAACDDYVREMEFVDEYRVAIYWFSDGSAIVRPYFGDDWNLFKDWYDGRGQPGVAAGGAATITMFYVMRSNGCWNARSTGSPKPAAFQHGLNRKSVV